MTEMNTEQAEFRPRAYSIKEACELLGGISRSTIYRYEKDGAIQMTKLGSRTVVMEAEINRFLNSLPPKSRREI